MKIQIIAVIISLIVFVSISETEGQDPSLRCPRCPIGCPSPQGYPLSCRNACRALSTRYTEVSCSAGRCNCKDPSAYPSSTRPPTVRSDNAVRSG